MSQRTDIYFEQILVPYKGFLELVQLFEKKYKHLAIRSVWLIEKLKENDGFQVWHRDFWLGHDVTSTIVVNVGAITRNYLGAMKLQQLSLAELNMKKS